jgi:type IV pilus assembly protein PilV
MMKRANMSQTCRGRGFTLIEVMVALVVLSIGLLGIGKLVLFSARANDSAYLRGQATAMAYEILDNMRSNRVTAMQAGYDTTLATTPPNPGSCIENVCTAGTLANYDMYQWKTRLAAALPSGQGSVVTAGTPTTATITVQWDDAVAQSTFDPAGAPVGVAQPMTVVLETVL